MDVTVFTFLSISPGSFEFDFFSKPGVNLLHVSVAKLSGFSISGANRKVAPFLSLPWRQGEKCGILLHTLE